MNDIIAKPIDFHKLHVIVGGAVLHGRAGLHRDGKADKATSGAEPHALINLSVLEALVGNQPEKMKKFADMFIVTATEALGEMNEALALSDIPRLRFLGHRTKSAAVAIGATRFAELCAMLEQDCPDEQSARALVAKLNDLLVKIQHAMRDIFATAPA